MKEKRNSKKTIGRLEKIKNASSGIAGGTALVTGIFTMNPILAISGATALFGGIISPTINAWRNQWFDDLYAGFKELEKKVDGFNLEENLKDPRIISVILEASASAIKTGQKEKHEFLRNAVLNISQDLTVKEDEQLLLIKTVDQLTPSHVLILQHLVEQNKKNPMERDYQLPDEAFLCATSLLESYLIFTTNLENLGLVLLERAMTTSTGQITWHPARVTAFGKKLLEFVTSHPS